MDLITLIDNVVYGEGLLGEHSSSFLIKSNGKTILFDVGQTDAYIANAMYLGEDLAEVDYVVLSHGQNEHNRGLEAFLNINSTATIYLKPAAYGEKIYDENTQKSDGFRLSKPLNEYPNSFVLVQSDLEITKGIKIFSDIYSFSNELKNTCDFYGNESIRQIQDPFADELFMMIQEGRKNFLFTGCAHKGIFNILKTAFEKNNEAPIQYVFGGMHFGGELLNQIDQYLKQFLCFGIEHLYVCHCTGIDGYMRLKLNLPDKVIYTFTGFQVEI